MLAAWSLRNHVPLNKVPFLNTEETLTKPRDYFISCVANQMTKLQSELFALLSFFHTAHLTSDMLELAWSRKRAASSDTRELTSGENAGQALKSLWRLSLVDLGREGRIERVHELVQDVLLHNLDDQTWADGFESVCQSVAYGWPSKRKLRNVMHGYWEDFDTLHAHVHRLAYPLRRDRLYKRSRYDPSDTFKRLLVHHTW